MVYIFDGVITLNYITVMVAPVISAYNAPKTNLNLNEQSITISLGISFLSFLFLPGADIELDNRHWTTAASSKISPGLS